jgi:SAM-dependent methyltransferase
MQAENESSTHRHLSADPGAAVYSPLVLKLYDWWVLGLSNKFAWRCSTRTVLLPFYRKHMGKKHLDAGVGTGFYLAHAGLGPSHEITLLDMNENSLRAAAARIRFPNVKVMRENVMRPLPRSSGERNDSISLFYLLHCLPGTMEEKSVAVASLKQYLKRDGIFYGATILGNDADHNAFGRRLMKIYNRKGIFSNQADSIVSLQEMLERHFENVRIQQHYQVALFEAREPIGVS